MADLIFTPPDAWANGFYTLAIDLNERSDEHSRAALVSLLSYPALDGWYLNRNKEPYEQPRVDASGPVENHRYGVLTLPNGKKVPCGCYIFHTQQVEPDWLELFIPLAAIDKIYPTGGFPFGPSQGYTAWQQEIDLALVEVARHVYRQVPFAAGMIDFEPDLDDMEYLFWNAVAQIPPENLRSGFLWAGANGLEWHPPKVRPAVP
ncbi:MAG: hypothetical protein WA738_04350 [Candidatus Angelobacter sp.]